MRVTPRRILRTQCLAVRWCWEHVGLAFKRVVAKGFALDTWEYLYWVGVGSVLPVLLPNCCQVGRCMVALRGAKTGTVDQTENRDRS
jgi:hypothetical protein